MNIVLLLVAVSAVVGFIVLYFRLNSLKREYREFRSKYRPVLSLKDEINRRQEELAELEGKIQELSRAD